MTRKTRRDPRLYPVILHQEGELWGYFSPQFGGGGAATEAEALQLAQEMIEEGLAEASDQGARLPDPAPLEDTDLEDGRIAYVRG